MPVEVHEAPILQLKDGRWCFMADKPYLTIEDVARRFSINTATVYRLAQRGVLPGFKVGGQWRFSQEILDSWVADRVTVEGFRRNGRRKDKAA